jgi:hypothetical protein
MAVENRYSAGQWAPQTGIYRVIHYQHRLPHKVVMREGQRFPACNTCGKRVSFRLSSTAEPLISDRDFVVKAA